MPQPYTHIFTSLLSVLRCCLFSVFPFVACLVKLLAKLHRIQAYVRRSTAAKARLNEAQRYWKLAEVTLPGACPTRWWTTTSTVQAFVKNERAVKMLCTWANDTVKKDNVPILTDNDWTVRVSIPPLTDHEEWAVRVVQLLRAHSLVSILKSVQLLLCFLLWGFRR